MRKRYPSQYLTITSAGRVRLGIYLHFPPLNGNHERSGPRPVHINFHAGGWCLNMHGTDAQFCALIAKQLGCYVVDAHYRMAPAHPFPAAYEDCKRVLAWVRANEGGLFDTSKITIGGSSSGGNLALSVAGTIEEPVQGVVAFYPPTDLTTSYRLKPAPPANLPRSKGLFISASEADLLESAYIFGHPRPYASGLLADPRLSPRFAPPERFPGKGRTMIVSCEYDFLGEEGREMVRVLEEGGREPVGVQVEGLGHGFDQMRKDGTEEAKVRDEVWSKAVEVIGRAQGREARG
ncbi:alpha/beta-hydrolase [Calocera cornea HHB12733]|uniref:Alpha/beta-hydrolase n=1 Tax=Calocera cornea HHB12733 TaxID=1353952 RepID=A0A165DML3_9BASI|nr:alpha/beta-hydrolase [Calocera cornea HHB12733]